MKASLSHFFPLILGIFVACNPAKAIVVQPVPRAIASVSLMTDEYLVNLVPPSRIVALSRDADNPHLSNIVAQARLVPGRVRLDAEALIHLNPDLVLAPDWSDAGVVKFLQQAGLRVEVIQTPRNWGQVTHLVTQLGTLLGDEKRAQQWLVALKDRVENLKERTPSLAENLKPTFLEYNEWGTSMVGGTLWPDILRLAGVRDAGRHLLGDRWGYAPMSMETLLKINPTWLVLPTEGALQVFGQSSWLVRLQHDSLFAHLRAVREGHVLELPERWKTATSPYVLQAAEAVNRAAYSKIQ